MERRHAAPHADRQERLRSAARRGAHAMIRLQLSLQLDYEVFAPGSDFVFNIHAAATARQRVLDEALTLSQQVMWRVETEPTTGNRYLRLSAHPGPLQVLYRA